MAHSHAPGGPGPKLLGTVFAIALSLAAVERAAAEEFKVVDGVLQPLADGFPSEPITLWNSFEPGSDDDVFNQVIARVGEKYAPVAVATATQQMGPSRVYGLADYLADRPGADQGYHIYPVSWFGITTRAFTTEALVDRSWEDLRASLNPINEMTFSPYSFLAAKDGPFKTIKDAEKFAKENPGQLKIASSSPGGGIPTSTLVWAHQAGIEYVYIPTDGPADSRQVLLGGGSQMATSRTEPGLDEQFQFLMITGDKRLDAFPDVPAASEFGYDIPSGTTRGFGTLRGVPKEHIDWLAEWLRMVSEDPEFRKQYADQDLTYRTAEFVEKTRDRVVKAFLPILEENGLIVRKTN